MGRADVGGCSTQEHLVCHHSQPGCVEPASVSPEGMEPLADEIPSTAEATGKVLQASNVFCALPRKDQTHPFPTHTEGMSLFAVSLLMFRSVGMNQKVAKFIC